MARAVSDRVAAVLRAAPIDGDEPPWDILPAGSIAVPLGLLDTDRLHWDGAAVIVDSRRFTPVYVNWLHRYLICQPIGG